MITINEDTTNQIDSNVLISMEAILSIVDDLRNLQTGLIITSRTVKMKTYENCFIGKEMVDWLIAHKFAPSRQAAVDIGKKMIQLEIIVHVKRTYNFSDDYEFYSFADDTIKALRKIKKKNSGNTWKKRLPLFSEKSNSSDERDDQSEDSTTSLTNSIEQKELKHIDNHDTVTQSIAYPVLSTSSQNIAQFSEVKDTMFNVSRSPSPYKRRSKCLVLQRVTIDDTKINEGENKKVKMSKILYAIVKKLRNVILQFVDNYDGTSLMKNSGDKEKIIERKISNISKKGERIISQTKRLFSKKLFDSDSVSPVALKIWNRLMSYPDGLGGKVLDLDYETLTSSPQQLFLAKVKLLDSCVIGSQKLENIASAILSYIPITDFKNSSASIIYLGIFANLTDTWRATMNDIVTYLYILNEFKIHPTASPDKVPETRSGGRTYSHPPPYVKRENTNEKPKPQAQRRASLKRENKIMLPSILPKILSNRPSNTGNIWDDKDLLTIVELDSAATLDKLVARVVCSEDPSFVDLFLTVYSSFCTSEVLFQKLLQFYEVPDDLGEEKKATLKKSVLSLIQRWLHQDIQLFDAEFTQKIKKFVISEIEKDNLKSFTIKILEEIQRRSRNFTAIQHTQDEEISYFILEESLQPHMLLNNIELKQIAKQMTFIDMSLLQRIEASEILNQKWNKPKSQIFARNLIAAIQWVNQISSWVASTILCYEKSTDRSIVVKQLISLSEILLEYENYNSLMGVLMGLSMSPISRLKQTFNFLSKKDSERLETLNCIQDPSNSFKNIREAIKKSNAAIPYVGLHLSDATSIEEGNPDEIIRDETQVKLINFPKYKIMGNTISSLLGYRGNRENIQKKEPLHTLLSSLPIITDKELYELSTIREPRE